jgi:hypothetical protein
LRPIYTTEAAENVVFGVGFVNFFELELRKFKALLMEFAFSQIWARATKLC